MASDIERLKRRLSDTDQMIADAAQGDDDDGYRIMGLEESRCGIITSIYEIEHPGMTLDMMGQPVKKREREPVPVREMDEADKEEDRHMTALFAAMDTALDKFRPGELGSIECPLCKGVLSISRAAYNGHVWGQCATCGASAPLRIAYGGCSDHPRRSHRPA